MLVVKPSTVFSGHIYVKANFASNCDVFQAGIDKDKKRILDSFWPVHVTCAFI